MQWVTLGVVAILAIVAVVALAPLGRGGCSAAAAVLRCGEHADNGVPPGRAG